MARVADSTPSRGRGLVLFGSGDLYDAVDANQISQHIDDLIEAAEYPHELQPDAVDILAYTSLHERGLGPDVLVVMNEELINIRRKVFKKAVKIVAANSLHDPSC